jgi:hypothetical protein
MDLKRSSAARLERISYKHCGHAQEGSQAPELFYAGH